jgi:hypothetical protein
VTSNLFTTCFESISRGLSAAVIMVRLLARMSAYHCGSGSLEEPKEDVAIATVLDALTNTATAAGEGRLWPREF